MDSSKNILFVDIGNSRIKLYYHNIKTAINYKNRDFIPHLTNYLHERNFSHIVYSSVNSNVGNIFLALAKGKKHREIICVNDLINEQNIIDLSQVKNMGNDRILGVFGALRNSKPPIITVDCGTAVTINTLNNKSLMLGGAIFAGVYTQRNSLASISDKLSHYKLNFEQEELGNNTSQALSFGIVYGTSGAIEKIISKILEIPEMSGASIYFTGGYGERILQHLQSIFPTAIYIEDLIFWGMMEMNGGE